MTILILAGTGKTGARIATSLRAAGAPVRTAARGGGDVRVDLGDPATWPPALDGVRAVYLVEPTIGTDPGRIPRFVGEAVAAGARRLVLLTAGRAEHPGHPLYAAEQAVHGSGVGWTVLHPTWFAQNFSEGPWRAGVLAGALALPTGDGAVPFVDARDIAEVAAAALTDDRHHGQTYALSGPRALTFAEAVAQVGGATGRTVRHVDIAPEEFTARQVADGLPRAFAELMTSLYTSIRDGEAAAVADGVPRALGRAATPFEDYAAADLRL